MKNPFELAQQLFDYACGRLNAPEREQLEQTLDEDLKLLASELLDKEHIRKELRVLEQFDTEKALQKIHGHHSAHRRLFAACGVAASLVMGIGVWWMLARDKQEVNIPLVATEESHKEGVLLEMASGTCYALDTLGTIRLEQELVELNNQQGVLRLDHISGNEATQPTESYNKITVPNACVYSLILADGTRICLNSGSVLEFPSRFSRQERRIKVSGEAYCEVARNEQHPFIVEAGDLSVKVLGTVFNIKAYPDEKAIYTTLVSGSVRVQSEQAMGKRLVPGELAVYSRESGSIHVEKTDMEEQTAWKDGIFYFKEVSLENILRVVSRWYDLEVFYANTAVRSVVFNGKIPMYSSVEDVLRKFEYSGEVHFDLKGRTLTVDKGGEREIKRR